MKSSTNSKPSSELPPLDQVVAERQRRKRKKAEDSLSEFVRQGWHVVEPAREYVPNWHIDAVCEHLEAVARGQIRELLINIPPGHMKSLLVSVFWPAWQWTRAPGWRALFSSYASDLAIRDSVRCRNLIESDWYQQTFAPIWKLSSDQNVKSYFENTSKGFRFCHSVGGRTTGFRGDAIVVDDPLNVLDAYSEVTRKEVITWWDEAMPSRLNDLRVGAKVIIMQRLHQEDLSGHVLGLGGYEHLCLPTEFDPKRHARTSIGWKDPRTAEGELLFPSMFPPDVVAKIKRKPSVFAGQHQQRPSPPEGNMFLRKWWQRYRQRPTDFDEVIQSWDCAFKDTKDSDFVVGQVWGRKGPKKYLLDQVRDRMNFAATCAAVKDLSAKWPQAVLKLIEDKANGPAVIETLKRTTAGIVAVNPQGGKEARAAAVQPEVEAGDVFIPEEAPWVLDFLEECSDFPKGAHDDQVDAMTQALLRLSHPEIIFR